MEFEWDEAKSNACLAERDFDFDYAAQAFQDPDRSASVDRRWDYGENRYRLLGKIQGRVFTLVYTTRGSTIRIISARKANRREIRKYDHEARKSES